MQYKILKAQEYEDWINTQPMKSRFQIAKRLEKIENHGHFGIIRDNLGHGVCELKWDNGRRVYYAYSRVKYFIIAWRK